MTMAKDDIILIGAGGHCRSVIDVIEQEGRYKIAGLIDEKRNVGQDVLGYQVIGCDDELAELRGTYSNALVTVGHVYDNSIRVRLFNKIKGLGFFIPTVVSPLAYVSRSASLGEGSVVMHHALVNAKSKVGYNCIINTKALIEHDVIVGNHCHISTASVLNGGAQVSDNVFFGSNATSVQGCLVQGFVRAAHLCK